MNLFQLFMGKLFQKHHRLSNGPTLRSRNKILMISHLSVFSPAKILHYLLKKLGVLLLNRAVHASTLPVKPSDYCSHDEHQLHFHI